MLMLLGVGSVNATGFENETLNYVVSYKWGLIHKDAGTATLQLRNDGNKYKIRLIGMTKPWADSFYQVRDTLLSTVHKQGLKPISYTKIAHEDGKFSRDDIRYSYSGSQVGGHATRVKINKKGERKDSKKDFSASGPTYDMLSVFYFLRNIDYSKLSNPNEEIKATLFSGSKVEQLTIRCVGKETIKLRDKSKAEAYHIKFKFTTEGKKKVAMISTLGFLQTAVTFRYR